jgi:hypothetical protein
MPGGTRTEIHLDGADTDGAFYLLIDNPPVARPPPPHLLPGRDGGVLP